MEQFLSSLIITLLFRCSSSANTRYVYDSSLDNMKCVGDEIEFEKDTGVESLLQCTALCGQTPGCKGVFHKRSAAAKCYGCKKKYTTSACLSPEPGTKYYGSYGIPGLSCPLTVAMGCTQDGSTSLDVHGVSRNVTMCQCTGNLDCVGGCQTDAITITSAQYGLLLDYYWYIEAPPGQTISITFSEVDIQRTTLCKHDSVEVYDGPTNTSTLAIKFCSTTIPPTITTTGNQMLVRFETQSDLLTELTVTAGFKSTVCFIAV